MVKKIYTRAEIDVLHNNLKQSKLPLVIRGAEMIKGLDEERDSLREEIILLKSLLAEKEYIVNNQQETLKVLVGDLAAGTKAVLNRIVEQVTILAKSHSTKDEPLCELAIMEALNIINSYLLPHDTDPKLSLFKEITDDKSPGADSTTQST